MRCWTSPEDVGKRMPVHSIEATKVSFISFVSNKKIPAFFFSDLDHGG